LSTASKRLSLLYVEDDETLREETQELFNFLFHDVTVCKNGEEGLSFYKTYYTTHNKYFDLVISDIKMPLMDGIKMSKEIYAIHKDQKIVITSAYDDKEYLLKLINLKIDGFLQKPLMSKDIKETLFPLCQEIVQSQESTLYIEIAPHYKWNTQKEQLLYHDASIALTKNEQCLLALLCENCNQTFTALEIFETLYYDLPEKKFSHDTIKSLVKRLRKKLPTDLIHTTPYRGYSIKK